MVQFFENKHNSWIGKPEYIASACKIIYKTLEKVSPNVEKIEKTPQPLELHKTRITV